MIREEVWQKLVDEGKVLNHQKVSVAKYVQTLCKAMAAADKTVQGHLKTPLHSSSKKYVQLTAYVRQKIKGIDASFTESEQSMISKFSPEDE